MYSFKFIAFVILIAFSGPGIYFGGQKAVGYFSGDGRGKPVVVKKISPVKPKMIRNKDSDKTSDRGKERFTFFEILNDPNMEKIVGLDGAIIANASLSVKEKALRKKPVSSTPPANSRIPASPAAESNNPTATKNLAGQSGTQPGDDFNFTVQVSSFKDLNRAEALRKKLKLKGFPAFLKMAALPEQGEWFRVFLGRYKDWESASLAAQKARNEEKLNAVVLRR
ncbi:MAG: SPOR domain-containing protein [Nitrospinota bacterium]|nr:SPOR domain-containing protein [Nitrospinota bacterium]